MTATLYVVPASHPCATVMRALELKGVPYRTVAWVPVVHKLPLRAQFGAPTVPAIKFDDGTKVSGSRAIPEELERRIPEPSLYGGGQAVRDAEAWGDEVLQPLVRRLAWHALSRRPGDQMSYLEGIKLRPPSPKPVARALARPLAGAARYFNKATTATRDADLAAFGEALDKVDGYIADGTLGGAHPNAADLQIGASVRLATTFEDLAPQIDARPAGPFARNCFENYPGRVSRGALSS